MYQVQDMGNIIEQGLNKCKTENVQRAIEPYVNSVVILSVTISSIIKETFWRDSCRSKEPIKWSR